MTIPFFFMRTPLIRAAALLLALFFPASLQAASVALVHDQFRQPHLAAISCLTCRYVVLRANNQQQFHMTRVGSALPEYVNETYEFVLLIDGSGAVSQYLPRTTSRRLTGWEVQAAVSTSAAKFCDFSTARDKALDVEYYDAGHEVQAIDDNGVEVTQAFSLAYRKPGVFYVFVDDETVQCGTAEEPGIAAQLVEPEIGPRPVFAELVQAGIEKKLASYFDIPMIPEPQLPPAPVLVRDEFETSEAFNRRVDAERKKREAAIYKQQQEFRRQVERRNELINSRQAQRDAYADRLARQATLDALGRLVLRNPEYDADDGLMYVDVVSTKSDFSRRLAFTVPIVNDQAKNLKQRIAETEISLRLDVSRTGISVRDAEVSLDGNIYFGAVAKGTAKSRIAQSIDLLYSDGQATAAAGVPAQLQSPDLVDRQTLRYDDGSVQDDVRGMVSALPTAEPDSTRWLFVVAVENYENADRVLYAKNSAELVVAAFQKKFGISARNTYALIDDKATAGAFKDKLATMLANVREGDTVYFYYSGHGIPDQRSDEAYILPRDKMVGFVANEEYLRLSRIYSQLAASKAGQVYAFVDSCFSGKTDNVSNFKGVAPGIFRSHGVVVDSKKMVVMTAGKHNQFSNAYVERGHRMFSYFLLKALLKPRPATAVVNAETLYQEIAVGVRDASNAKGDAYLQEPQLLGNAVAPL